MPFAPRHCEKSERRLSKVTSGVLQLTSHGIAGFATVGHLVLPHEENIRTAEGSAGSRSVLDLKFDDPKADVERVLDPREDELVR
jgi:hypothetical protein